ncbi:MAG: peptidylprolyl isomerase [Thiobacillaceae bacterium]|jgi:FKBP-type peptidyl-prolyl cis-trans isomerase SlyD|nr:peptidylprolyl isomerase [Thiobacillaceae bacterium]
MRISRNHVVTLHYQVADKAGEVVDAGSEPLVYLHGGYGGLFDALEVALQGKSVGDAFRVELTAEEAFGDYDEALVSVEPRSAFPKDIKVGTRVETEDEDGEPMLFTITAIEKNQVVVDGNPPLAGLDLVFSGTVAAVRPATEMEIAAGAPD